MTTEAVIDADALINSSRIGRMQVLVAVLGALVLFADGFDTQVIAYITPQIARNWHIPRALLGPIFSSGLVGLLTGYLVLSPLSAKFGHKRMATFCVGVFGALTFLTASTHSAPELMVCRFLTGIGLGGAIPSAVALTGEYTPQHRRSSFITFMYVGFSAGQASAGGVAAFLLGRFGWQSVLWVGGAIPLAIAAVLAAAMPESLEFLINKRRDWPHAAGLLQRVAPGASISAEARLVAGERNGRSTSVTQLFQAGRSLGTLALWVALFMNLMINYFVQNWLPTILIGIGLTQDAAIAGTTMTMFGGILAAFIVGPAMDWLGAYRVMAAIFFCGAVFVALIGVVIAPPLAPLALIMAATFCAGFCTSGVQKSANALAILFYPTALRTAGLGWALGIGRIGAILGPLVAGFLLGLSWLPPSLFYAAAVPMLCGMTAMIVMGRLYEGGARRRPVVPGQDGVAPVAAPRR